MANSEATKKPEHIKSKINETNLMAINSVVHVKMYELHLLKNYSKVLPLFPFQAFQCMINARDTSLVRWVNKMAIGPGEWFIIIVVALLIFGPKKLPELGRAAGTTLREFKKALSGESSSDTEEKVK